MKRSNVFIILVLTIMGCNSSVKQHTVRDFMPGMYIRTIHHEFAIGSDTLVLKPLQGNSYAILKWAGFQRILNGKLAKSEHTAEQWTALYEEKDKVLLEQKHGKIMSFDPPNNSLFLGGTEYKKVNP
jgi:hypothetical protein